jgi:hypothetical protein
MRGVRHKVQQRSGRARMRGLTQSTKQKRKSASFVESVLWRDSECCGDRERERERMFCGQRASVLRRESVLWKDSECCGESEREMFCK